MPNAGSSQNANPYHPEQLSAPSVPPPSNAVVLSQPHTSPTPEYGDRMRLIVCPIRLALPVRAAASLEWTPCEHRHLAKHDLLNHSPRVAVRV